MGKSVQAQATEIEWRRMADQDRYYALRDGPRLQRSLTAISTLERYLPDEHVALARNIASMHGEVHSGFGRGAGEAVERVQGGDGGSARDMRLMRLSALVRSLAGYQAASLRVGLDGFACYRGICFGDTQAEMMRRARYPTGSKQTFRRLVQRTLIELHEHKERTEQRAANDAIDIESNFGPISL